MSSSGYGYNAKDEDDGDGSGTDDDVPFRAPVTSPSTRVSGSDIAMGYESPILDSYSSDPRGPPPIRSAHQHPALSLSDASLDEGPRIIPNSPTTLGGGGYGYGEAAAAPRLISDTYSSSEHQSDVVGPSNYVDSAEVDSYSYDRNCFFRINFW